MFVTTTRLGAAHSSNARARRWGSRESRLEVNRVLAEQEIKVEPIEEVEAKHSINEALLGEIVHNHVMPAHWLQADGHGDVPWDCRATRTRIQGELHAS